MLMESLVDVCCYETISIYNRQNDQEKEIVIQEYPKFWGI